MKIEIELMTIGNQTVALPRSQNAFRGCQLVRRDYMTTQEIKILSKMGFEILEVPQKNKKKENQNAI
jgi:hypothetical protein